MNFESDNPEPTYYNAEVSTRIMHSLQILYKDITSTKCVSCGHELSFDHADIYDHEYGWNLTSLIPKQWVSFHCDCGYDTSLNKLGVSRYKNSLINSIMPKLQEDRG